MPKERKVEVLFKEEIYVETFGKSIVKNLLESKYPSLKITSIDSVNVGKDSIKMEVQSNILKMLEQNEDHVPIDAIRKSFTHHGSMSTEESKTSIFGEGLENKTPWEINLIRIQALKDTLKETDASAIGTIYEQFNKKVEEEIAALGTSMEQLKIENESMVIELEKLRKQQSSEMIQRSSSNMSFCPPEVLQMQLDVMKQTVEEMDNEKTKIIAEKDRYKTQYQTLLKTFEDYKKNNKPNPNSETLRDSFTSIPRAATTMVQPKSQPPQQPQQSQSEDSKLLMDKIMQLQKKMTEKEELFEDEKREMNDKISMLSYQNLNSSEKIESLEKDLKKSQIKMESIPVLTKEIEEIRSQLIDKNQRISLLNSQIMKQQGEYEALQKKFNQLTQQHDTLVSSSTKLQDELQSKEGQLGQTSNSVKQFEMTLQNLNKKVFETEKAKAELDEKNKKFESVYKKVNEEKEIILKKYNQLRDEKQVQDNKISRLSISLGEAQEKLQEKIEQLSEMEEKLNQRERDESVRELKKEHESKQMELLRSQLNLLEESKDTWDNERSELKQKIDKLEDDLSNSQKQVEELKDENENLELQLNDKETKINLLTFNKEKMEQMVEVGTDIKSMLEAKIQENEKNIQAYKKIEADFNKQKEEMLNQIKGLQTDVQNAQNVIRSKEETIKELEQKISDASEEESKNGIECVNLQKVLKEKDSEKEELELRISELLIHNQNLKSTLQNLKNQDTELEQANSKIAQIKQEKTQISRELTKLTAFSQEFANDLKRKIEEISQKEAEIDRLKIELKMKEEEHVMHTEVIEVNNIEKCHEYEEVIQKLTKENSKLLKQFAFIEKSQKVQPRSQSVTGTDDFSEMQLHQNNSQIAQFKQQILALEEENLETAKACLQKDAKISELETQIKVNVASALLKKSPESEKELIKEQIRKLESDLENARYEKLNLETEFQLKLMKEKAKYSKLLEEKEQKISTLKQNKIQLVSQEELQNMEKLEEELDETKDKLFAIEKEKIEAERKALAGKTEIFTFKKRLLEKQAKEAQLLKQIESLKSELKNKKPEIIKTNENYELILKKMELLKLPTGKLIFEENKLMEMDIGNIVQIIQTFLDEKELKISDSELLSENTALLREIIFAYKTLITICKEIMERKSEKSAHINELTAVSQKLKEKLTNKQKLELLKTINKDEFPFLNRIKMDNSTLPLLVPCLRTEIKFRQLKLSKYQDDFSKFRKIVTVAEDKCKTYYDKFTLLTQTE